MGLSDKVVVITGAARGIGLAIARQAALDGVGALVLTDRDDVALTKAAADLAATTRVITVVADLALPEAVARIAFAATDNFGRIDGLVNAAGVTTRGSVLTGTLTVWDQVFAINARAAFFLMQAAIADMKARGATGSVVNIASMNAHCGIADLAIYAASKGALVTLTRNAAQAHMADRIRVNAINLGWVATESEHHMQSEVLGLGSDWLAAAAAAQPLGRLVTAAEMARLAVFLLGDASVPMSGAVIDFEQKVAGAL